jgi:hypothetical protein
MAYGRNPHYIYSNGKNLIFVPFGSIPENVINAFLYKLLLKGRRHELRQRLIQGKQEWMKKIDVIYDTSTNSYGEMIEVPQNEDYIKWMEEQEDNVLKSLIETL